MNGLFALCHGGALIAIAQGHHKYEAERKPKSLYELERELYKYTAQTPAFAAFVQLPPELTQHMSSLHRIRSRWAANLCIHRHLAQDVFVKPATNHPAHLIDQARDNQVAVRAGIRAIFATG